MKFVTTIFRVEESWFRVQGMMGRSEVWKWSRITWSYPGGMEDRKGMAVMAAWWCHREKT